MELFVTPFSNVGSFQGSIYLANFDFEPACVLDNQGDGTYSKRIPFDSCGGAAINDSNGDVTRTFIAVVQYDTNFLTGSDQELAFACTIKQSGSNVTWESEPVQADKNAQLPRQEFEEDFRPINFTLEILGQPGQPVNNPVTIGTQMIGRFVNVGANFYPSFSVQSVTMTNAMSGDQYRSFDLISGGCVTAQAGTGPLGKKVVTDFSGDGKTESLFTFNVVKLPMSYQLAFDIVVRLCGNESTSCDITDCTPNDFPGLGRKKRSVADNDKDLYEQVQNKGILVLVPGLPANDQDLVDPFTQQESDDHDILTCFTNVLYLCVVVVAMVLSALTGVLCSLCTHNFRARKGQIQVEEDTDAFQNQGYNYTAASEKY